MSEILPSQQNMSTEENAISEIVQEEKTEPERCCDHIEMYKKLLTDTNTKKAEFIEKIQALTKQHDAAVKDKQSMVMKYAMAQKDVLDVQKERKQLAVQVNTLNKDKETLRSSIKSLSEEKRQVILVLNRKTEETIQKMQEIEKLNNVLKNLETKSKWRDRKLEEEIESHKKTKQLLEAKIQRASVDPETSGPTVDVETQTSDSTSMASLEQTCQEQRAHLIMERQKNSEINAQLSKLTEELQTLRTERINYVTHNSALKKQIDKSEAESKKNAEAIQTLSKTVNDLKAEKISYIEEKKKTEELGKQVERLKENLSEYENHWELLENEIKEKNAVVSQCRDKETELLEFTTKLSERNATLQNELSSINSKIPLLKKYDVEKNGKIEELSKCLEESKQEKIRIEKKSTQEIDALKISLEEKTKSISSLETTVSDLKNEIGIQQKKYQHSLKDANREISKLTKKVDALQEIESRNGKITAVEGSTMEELKLNPRINEIESEDHSRSSSSTSLNVLGQKNLDRSPDSQRDTPDHMSGNYNSMLDPTVVEKLWQLKSTSLKKDEKIQFLEEHVAQLLSELQKKNKIVSNYLLKHETGVLSSNASDCMKTEMIKKGGIMASVYGSAPKDDTITLELSLEINKKLQGILEDTLLKNITLKENLNTLAAEIATLTLKKSHQ